MRALTKSERRLTLLFLGLVFVVANVLALEAIIKKRRTLEREITRLNLEQREASAWMSDRDYWMKRKAWLDEKQPKLEVEGQESARLLETLQQSARQQNITISTQRLIDPKTTTYYREGSVQLEIKGRLESVTRWLAQLQEPARFQAVTSLTLKSDTEPPKVIVNLTVARWYALP
jgi:Tfp pilus assembly protein PilO